MKYELESMYSELLFAFEIDEEFIINYKAYKTFLDYKKTFESEKRLNYQESVNGSVKEKAGKIEETKKETKVLLN
jgi:hypothetical protein